MAPVSGSGNPRRRPRYEGNIMNSTAFTRQLVRAFAVALLLASVAATAGCGIYRRDKCYVAEPRYTAMRDIFVESGSIELVRQRMDELQWMRCEKNEVLYRLRKEFEVPAE
jgi:hypothetical protein